MKNRRGFTLIEMLMTILLIGVLAVVSIGYISEDSDEAKYDATRSDLQVIQKALIGDENVTQDGSRMSFGFIGDIGAMPSALSQLTAAGGLPAWNFDSSLFVGAGWAGPYLRDEVTNYLKDAWGTDYAVSFGSPVTITSYGSDKVAGGTGTFDSDITITIPTTSFISTVTGFVTNGGIPYNGAAQVELYAPNGLGAVATTLYTVNAGTSGAFSFSNVPFGKRSLRAFIPTKASPITDTIGPKEIIVDRSNYAVPSGVLDLSNCTFTDHIVYQVATKSYSGGNAEINFSYNVTTATTIQEIIPHWVNSRTLTTITLTGTNYAASNSLSGQRIIIGRPAETVGDGKSAKFTFNASLTGVAPSQTGQMFTVDFIHSSGCSRIMFVM